MWIGPRPPPPTPISPPSVFSGPRGWNLGRKTPPNVSASTFRFPPLERAVAGFRPRTVRRGLRKPGIGGPASTVHVAVAGRQRLPLDRARYFFQPRVRDKAGPGNPGLCRRGNGRLPPREGTGTLPGWKRLSCPARAPVGNFFPKAKRKVKAPEYSPKPFAGWGV